MRSQTYPSSIVLILRCGGREAVEQHVNVIHVDATGSVMLREIGRQRA